MESKIMRWETAANHDHRVLETSSQLGLYISPPGKEMSRISGKSRLVVRKGGKVVLKQRSKHHIIGKHGVGPKRTWRPMDE